MDASDAARSIFGRALEAVRPDEAVLRQVHLEGATLVAGPHRLDLDGFSRVRVLGLGKAAAAMGMAVETILADRLQGGLVVVPEGTPDPGLRRLELFHAGHPLPDQRSLEAGRRALELADSVGAEDLVLALVSGGGSAVLEKPAGRFTLEHLQHTTQILLYCGAPIREINTLRRHLSEVKGGRLMARLAPATVLTLVLSDVVGSPLDAVASGPTCADPSTWEDALRLVDVRQLSRDLPNPVLWYLREGAEGQHPDTPKPGDPIFRSALYHVVGDNSVMARAALEEAGRLGYQARILTTWLDSEAREVAQVLASVAREIRSSGSPVGRPGCLVLSGEPRVTVTGRGKGGRCQELALAFALACQGMDGVTLLAAGSDGRDGPTDAAGAVVDAGTCERGRRLGLDPQRHLDENDSYCFFRDLGEILRTGPTGTNTNDLVLLLVE